MRCFDEDRGAEANRGDRLVLGRTLACVAEVTRGYGVIR
jgi:hypothetical protein